jgi:hypothetical protein
MQRFVAESLHIVFGADIFFAKKIKAFKDIIPV